MPDDARILFQKEVFHSVTVSAKLQGHLGMMKGQQIFYK